MICKWNRASRAISLPVYIVAGLLVVPLLNGECRGSGHRAGGVRAAARSAGVSGNVTLEVDIRADERALMRVVRRWLANALTGMNVSIEPGSQHALVVNASGTEGIEEDDYRSFCEVDIAFVDRESRTIGGTIRYVGFRRGEGQVSPRDLRSGRVVFRGGDLGSFISRAMARKPAAEDDIGRAMLEKARAHYREGRLTEALVFLGSVGPASPVYKEAGELVALIQGEMSNTYAGKGIGPESVAGSTDDILDQAWSIRQRAMARLDSLRREISARPGIPDTLSWMPPHIEEPPPFEPGPGPAGPPIGQGARDLLEMIPSSIGAVLEGDAIELRRHLPFMEAADIDEVWKALPDIGFSYEEITRFVLCVSNSVMMGRVPSGGILIEGTFNAGGMMQRLMHNGWEGRAGGTYLVDGSGQAIAGLDEHLLMFGEEAFVRKVAGAVVKEEGSIAAHPQFARLARVAYREESCISAYFLMSEGLKDIQRGSMAAVSLVAKLMDAGVVSDLVKELPNVDAAAAGLSVDGDKIVARVALVLDDEQKAAEIFGLIELAGMFLAMDPRLVAEFFGGGGEPFPVEGLEIRDTYREDEMIVIGLAAPIRVLLGM